MKAIIVLFAASWVLVACQTTQQSQHSISLSEAKTLPILADLPLLTISVIKQQQGQRIITMLNDFDEIFRMAIAEGTPQAKIPLSVGKKIKVIGNYTETATMDGKIVIQITPEKITLLR